ncbi:MAG: DUF1223 domain-containing protein [Pseudomonadota bacterium]
MSPIHGFRGLASILAGLLLTGVAGAADERPTLELRSGTQATALVELYTSEGCSSCPPADRWLSSLKSSPQLWQTLVPVAFHVDYWDYIGWPDRFADAAYGQRQRRHAREGRSSGVYTPGMFVDGAEWRSWRRGGAPTGSGAAVGTLAATLTDTAASIRFNPEPTIDGPFEATVAFLGLDLTSQVRAGENRGRRLVNDFVVLGLRRVALKAGATIHQGQVPLGTVPADTGAVAVWVSRAGALPPIQATGGWWLRAPTLALR